VSSSSNVHHDFACSLCPPLSNRPVDAENANFRITTAQLLDQPEVGTLGSMNTGFHG
jgi:hypothetical protein